MGRDCEKVASIKSRLEHGSYDFDPSVVADAILRRLAELTQARREWLGLAREPPANGHLKADARIQLAIRLHP